MIVFDDDNMMVYDDVFDMMIVFDVFDDGI